MEQFRPNILVVDDDPALLSLLIDTLLAIGYNATGSANGVRALEVLAETSFALMITDIRMPKLNGLQLRDRVRRLYPDMPILFVTGVAYSDIIAQASPEGVLAKPFRISQIEEMIESALNSTQLPSASR